MSKRIPVLFSIFTLLVLTACSSQPAAVAPKETKRVAVVPVKREQAVRVVELSGTLQPNEETLVAFEVPGRIVDLKREEGDRVEAGELLGQVDASDYSLQLAQASESVQQAEATLQQVNNGAREQEIAQAKAAVEKAQVAWKQAESDFKRIEKLYEEKAVSQNDYENAQNRLTLAEKDLLTAQQAYSLVTQGARSEVREQTRSSYELALLAKQQAALTLSKTELKAPISGTVIAKLSSPGELISVGTPVYKIGDIDMLKVVLPVPDREISEWKQGDTVTLSLYSETREGTVTNILPATNQNTGTISVEVSVPNPEHDWYVGQVVTANRTITGSEGIYVPIEAVLSRGEETPHVFLLQDGKAVKTPVSVGQLFDNKLEITSGLKEGDVLIVKGADRLFDGDQVEAAAGGK
ncbi:efflux RND transporter periplasmic adaptor subunit [Brevibacillus humidisoli]|uniref:efflux RND transporter periplasmic adaptor subunit n=1 Tax=Brevibacillus humidisoli TaxID=2895522 RepID=UPI001E375DDF|nr:efflux RND transporter periplasmic adaptor subunit [Brevibacillus humidisoli]UFJ40230.1 efflux RND transporter periplasmic adaptor subunit [Brevibacillus humidisoli]